MAEQGYRVLALAEGLAPKALSPRQVPPEPTQLTLLGFVGMIDPLRPGVKESIAACHQAGIAVWMVTGDHPATALAIARDRRALAYFLPEIFCFSYWFYLR